MVMTFKPYPAILIDGSAFGKAADIKWYENDTLGVLNQVKLVKTGRILFGYIQSIKAGRTVTIKPYNWAYIKKTFGKDAASNLWNAIAHPTDFGKAADSGQSVIKEVFTGVKGGSQVNLHFTKWVINNKKYRKMAGVPAGGAGSTPDEIMVHELVHAAAQMLGRDDRTATGDKMDEVTEFRSIVVTNIYATDSSNPSKHRPVRQDHGGSTTMTSTTGDLEGDFLKIGSYRQYTRALIARLPGLALQLALVDATFNPIRRFLKDALTGK